MRGPESSPLLITGHLRPILLAMHFRSLAGFVLFAATTMVIGHRYDLTGAMSKDAHTGELMMTVPTGTVTTGMVRIVPSLGGADLDAVFNGMKPGQSATASGVYLGEIPGAGSD